MVNKSTNICKANNNFSLQIIKYRKNTTYDVGHPYYGLGQAQTCGGLKPVNGIPTPPFSSVYKYYF
jgi:hypothetical protein